MTSLIFVPKYSVWRNHVLTEPSFRIEMMNNTLEPVQWIGERRVNGVDILALLTWLKYLDNTSNLHSYTFHESYHRPCVIRIFILHNDAFIKWSLENVHDYYFDTTPHTNWDVIYFVFCFYLIRHLFYKTLLYKPLQNSNPIKQ